MAAFDHGCVVLEGPIMFHRVLSVSLSVDVFRLRHKRFNQVSRLPIEVVSFTDVNFRGGLWKILPGPLPVPLPLRSYMMRHKKA